MRQAVCLLVATLLALALAGAVLAAPVDIMAPPNGATISGDDENIVVSLSELERRPITKVEVYLDGNLITNRKYDTGTNGGKSVFRWVTTRTPNGKHSIKVIAYSNDEAIGTAACTVMVENKAPDVTAPKIQIASPKEGQVVSGTTPIVVQVVDDSGLNPFVSIAVDKAIRSVSNVPPFLFNWNTTTVDNGPHYIDVSASDDGDNKASARTIRVIVRNPVKQIPITAQSEKKLPVLKDVLPEIAEKPVSAGASKATPTASAEPAKTQELARTAPNPGQTAESLDVGQLPTPKPVEMAALPAPTAGPAPENLELTPATPEPSQTVESSPAAPALPDAELSTELPTAQESPMQMAKVPEAMTSVAESILSIPAVPATTVVESSVPAPTSESTFAVPETPVAKAEPAAPALELPDGSVSVSAESPVLMAKLLESDLALAASPAESKVISPDVPSSMPVTVREVATVAEPMVEAELTLPAVDGVISVPAESPVLMAKLLDPSPAAPMAITESKVIAPAAPKAKPMVVASAPIKTAAPVKVAQASTETKRESVSSKPKSTSSKKSVRIRTAIENAGGSILWSHEDKTVHAVAAHKDIKLKIGSTDAEVDSLDVTMDKAPFISEGRTMVPDTFIKDTLGL